MTLRKVDSTQENTADISNQIRNAKWRQGTVFLPNELASPPYEFDLQNEVCILVTQSCSIVSHDFEKDPFVEVLIARKLLEFNERSVESRGKNQRKLHVKTQNENQDCLGFECDFNKRFFIERKILPSLTPIPDYSIDIREIKKLARWIGRHYTRIALPDELVNCMKPNLLPLLNKLLKKDYRDEPLHSEIDSIYILWEERKETADSPLFALNFIFLCTSQDSADKLQELLNIELTAFLKRNGQDNIHIEHLICGDENSTFISDIKGYERLSEWDYLTDFGGAHWFATEK
jgi:hypothetical protein